MHLFLDPPHTHLFTALQPLLVLLHLLQNFAKASWSISGVGARVGKEVGDPVGCRVGNGVAVGNGVGARVGRFVNWFMCELIQERKLDTRE
mmetsp:Transcript_278/g.617  ORF Transcript_278/g.617 Transcript_278/m.617 type:complete len:91 (-) Transcript_278:1549-1821(-)